MFKTTQVAIVVTKITVLTLLGGAAALAQSDPAAAKKRVTPPVAAKPAAPQPAAPQPAQAATPAAGQGKALSEVLARAGVVTCGPRVEQIGDFLLQQGEAGAFLFLPESAPNQRQVGVALEIATPGAGPSAYASAEFSPEAAGGCGASYQAISYWPVACPELARTTFAASKSLGMLKRNIQMLELTALGRVFLMPAGAAGCVAIKRELLR